MRLVVSQQGQLIKHRQVLTCGSQIGCSSLQVLLRLPAALIHRKGLLWWVFKRVFVGKWSNFHQTKSTSLKPPPRHVCVGVSSPQYTMLTDIKKSSSSPLGVEATGRKWIDGLLTTVTGVILAKLENLPKCQCRTLFHYLTLPPHILSASSNTQNDIHRRYNMELDHRQKEKMKIMYQS